MDKGFFEAIDAFYTAYMIFLRKSGDKNTAIQLTCAMFGIKVPESNSFSFMFGREDKKRNE